MTTEHVTGPLKVGIDLDCVLNNLTEEWVDAYNSKHDESLPLADIDTWDLTEHMPLEENPYDLITDNLLTNLKPIEGAIEATKRLSANPKVELYIVTASYPESMATKLPWLKIHFPHIKPANIIVIQDKSLVHMDVLVDDALHNIRSFPNESILLDYPWNQDGDEDEAWYYRAHNWIEIEYLLTDLVQHHQARERMFEGRPPYLSIWHGEHFPPIAKQHFPLYNLNTVQKP